ncbi:MAG: RluA family pseudouridine synthase, partial [Halobacteriovoraceae bacterium]|nr:RluA family pseudouridine synthase [Halobacteriovoraceae bacterium]
MDQPEERTLLIAKDDLQKFKRLDAFLACSLPDMSRTLIKKIFLEGHITSSQKLELKKMPPAGTKITIILPAPAPTTIIPQDIPLDILYEDEYLLIINKPAGLVVHPAPGNFDGTLVNAILFHCHDLKGIGNEMRPGIVHRLDKGTSGIMVVAKEQKTHEGLVRLFSTHDIERKYQAICLGTKLPPKTTLE